MAKPDWVTDIRFFETKGENGPVAKGSITVADALFIRFTVWKGKDAGEFRIALPAEKNPNFKEDRPAGKENPKFFDQVGPVSTEVRQELYDYILSQIPGKETPAPAGKKTPTAGVAQQARAMKGDSLPF